jgi:hypothetical protein
MKCISYNPEHSLRGTGPTTEEIGGSDEHPTFLCCRQLLFVLLGLASLALGLLFYLVARPSGATYFQQHLGWLDGLLPHIPIEGRVAGIFPEFIHPFGFSLLGMGLCPEGRVWRVSVCAIFMGMNLFFEFGQKFKDHVVSFVPDWFGGIPLVENVKAYFLRGTFSFGDVFAIMLGAVMALVVAELVLRDKEIEGGKK